ncbi:hypothetical protein POM88_020825 [Heracleum sosnowskyi]|uniref:Uncharacterized protein n=1 Tax=Heracleum sosnowskyi TaxID=360622 RepID=A0AAD8ICK0_9APIA|nr:hypothetical protein POM88_020825 [Heracleum sosnowskyi]
MQPFNFFRQAMGMDDEVNHYEQGAKLSEEEIKKAYRSKLLILMDKKARQRKNKSQQQTSDSSKRRNVDQREQAARAAYSAAKQARDMEAAIRTSDQQLIARIKRDAAKATSKAPPAAAPSTLNKRVASSTHCPCGQCQGAHCLDREFSSNFNCGAGFEAYQNSFLSKFRTKDVFNLSISRISAQRRSLYTRYGHAVVPIKNIDDFIEQVRQLLSWLTGVAHNKSGICYSSGLCNKFVNLLDRNCC